QRTRSEGTPCRPQQLRRSKLCRTSRVPSCRRRCIPRTQSVMRRQLTPAPAFLSSSVQSLLSGGTTLGLLPDEREPPVALTKSTSGGRLVLCRGVRSIRPGQGERDDRNSLSGQTVHDVHA